MRNILETAKARERDGDYVSALELYRQAYVRDCASQDATLGIAQCALALDNHELALEFYVRLLIRDHDNPWGYIGRANVLMRCGQAGRALSDLAKAVRLDTPASALRIDIAAVLNANDCCQEALEALSPARDDFIRDPDFMCEWGFALIAQGHLDHPDLPGILAYFELHESEDPFYSLFVIAAAARHGDETARTRLTALLDEAPELEDPAQTLGLFEP